MIGAELPITYHTVMLGALTRDGDTLAEITWQDEPGEERTHTLHVPAGLPGETVTIAIEAASSPPRRRKRHWKPRQPRVWITEIQQASPLRVEAPCPVFGVCGGCQLQHMRYESQLEWKHSIVRQLLQESGFDNPPVLETVACDDPWHYRNHMRFSVNRDGQPGLTARGTHRVLPLTRCPIAHKQINRVLGVLSTLPNERPQALVRCGAATGHVLIQPRPREDVARQLVEEGLDLRSEAMEERLGGEAFRIRPSSFFQTNTAQAEKMVRMMLDGLLDGTASEVSSCLAPAGGTLSGGQVTTTFRTIVDAYCGVGTFALLLARHVGKVIAIEESASAIRDAEWNLREVHNVEIRKGKVEDLLPTLECQVDGLVIDPPRAGCQQAVLDALVRHPVGRIVYVSCDPATLARDLHILCNVHPTYRLRSVQPLDMFPQTAHIECVAVLEHRQL
jgi:23S rRNA (uracil1939-C5)-methyltransferase